MTRHALTVLIARAEREIELTDDPHGWEGLALARHRRDLAALGSFDLVDGLKWWFGR